MKQIIFLLTVLASFGATAQRASYNERVAEYIRVHKDWAEAEQRRSGVPAAITLAQGVHETEAGNSELATKANNHFGIKCKKEWTGETFNHDDDAPQECFRKYNSALESYKDHSDYLKTSKRYQSCFALDARDYAGWARELRKCGYATNPVYAQRLIKIIEDNHLQDYTIAAMNPLDGQNVLLATTASPAAAAVMAEEAKQSKPGEVVPDKDTPAEEPVYGKVVRKDGLKGFWAHKGDVLLEYAIQYKVRYAKLLEINNLPDAPLAADQFVFLEKGGAVERMMAKDASTPIQVTPAPAMATEVTAPAEAVHAAATPTENVTSTPIVAHEADAITDVTPAAPAPAVAPAAAQSQPTSALDATAAAEERLFGTMTTASAPVVAPATQSVAIKTNADKPFNIAAEKAVEEQKPEEPQDEFSKMKSRFDRVVYAPAKPAAATSSTTTAAPAAPRVEKVVAAAAAIGPVYHTVKTGETAFGIAKQNGITMQQLMDLNKMSFGTGIKVGQKLRVK